jgi:hypothetical protein
MRRPRKGPVPDTNFCRQKPVKPSASAPTRSCRRSYTATHDKRFSRHARLQQSERAAADAWIGAIVLKIADIIKPSRPRHARGREVLFTISSGQPIAHWIPNLSVKLP